jgi:hypothetical protein
MERERRGKKSFTLERKIGGKDSAENYIHG